MAFTRKNLSALGIEAEKIEAIMDMHVEVVNGLKEQIETNKADNNELATVKAELEQAKNSLKEANTQLETARKDDYKGKYESLIAEYEKYKGEVNEKETNSTKKNMLRESLKKGGYSEQAINLIVNRSDFSKQIELDENGKAKNADAVVKAIKDDADFSGFTPQIESNTTTLATPPTNTGGGAAMTKDDIMKIEDTTERQKAIAANPDIFGLS